MKVTSFVIGLGVGAAVAMLCAPRTGEETRQILGEKAERGRRFIEDRANELCDTANDLADRGREVLNRQKGAVTAAAQAAKDAYVREAQTKPA
jgi:gas vesicle protein